MKLSSTPTISPPPNFYKSPNSQAETLSSLCNWWINTKQDAPPSICHWFGDPEKNQRGSSLVSNLNQIQKINSFSSFGYPGHVDKFSMQQSLHSTGSISLILILGAILFILLIVAFITCISRKKRLEPSSSDDRLNQSLSNHILQMLAISHSATTKDHPPGYVDVVKMKKEEDEELPTYSEALEIESIKHDQENVV